MWPVKIFMTIVVSYSNCQQLKFPDNFKFGVATSAFQIEGAWNVDGKSANIWDVASHNRSELILDKSNGDVACDSYNKWEEDVLLVKNLGVDYYRISLSWTRLLPDPFTNKVNPAGVAYYNKILDKLLENGVEPMVTIFHWDLPQVFSSLGGWTNPIVINHYANFARTAFELFGDRIKSWITINEPRLVCQRFKGLVGDVTLYYPLGVAEYLCTHNVLKAHAEAYHIYDKEFRWKQKGRIGITLDISWSDPENSSNPDDVLAAEQNIQFDFGIFANPILNYDYPKVVKHRMSQRSKLQSNSESRLPEFTLAEKLKIRGTYDFLGINHYITQITRAGAEPPINETSIENDAGGIRYYHQDWEPTGAPWIFFTPWGMRKSLNWIKRHYGNPEIIITENGYADDHDVFEDDNRIKFYKTYLKSTLQAIIEDGVKVTGFLFWTLMDNYEWTFGHTVKFGMYHVNFTDPNRTRTARASVEFVKNLMKTKTIE